MGRKILLVGRFFGARQRKKGSVDIREFVGVEEGEADVGEGAGAEWDVGGAEVGDEVGVGVERLGEGEFIAGIFFHSFAADFAGRGGRGGRVVGDAPLAPASADFPVTFARHTPAGARTRD